MQTTNKIKGVHMPVTFEHNTIEVTDVIYFDAVRHETSVIIVDYDNPVTWDSQYFSDAENEIIQEVINNREIQL